MSNPKLNKDSVSYVIVGIAFFTAFISFFSLPEQIPMQWSGTEVIWYTNKIAIFSIPIISFLFFMLFRPLLRVLLSKSAFSSPHLPEIIMAGILFIFLSCEVFTIMYCFGFGWRLEYILIIEGILLLIICIVNLYRFNRKTGKQS